MPNPSPLPASVPPPVDTGRFLSESRRGPDHSLRATLIEGRDGEPLVRLRNWTRAESGGWFPKPGPSVYFRMAELPLIREALALAEGIAGAGQRDEGAGELDAVRDGMRAILAGGHK